MNFRDTVEKRLREGFGDRFEVISITWHKPDEEPRPFGRDGWHEKPLAYVLLKAKDPATDRIPSLALDLDFVEDDGAIVLPVASGVVVVDARPGTAVSGANSAIELTQVLDPRELAQGKVALEIQAHGLGLIRPVEQWLDLEVSGFARTALDDQGLMITGLDTSGQEVRPLSERRARIEYRPLDPGAGFRFPVARAGVDITKTIWQRYQDVDLVDSAAVASLAAPTSGSWRLVLVIGCAGLGVIGLLAWWRRRRTHQREAPTYVVPERISPFTARTVLIRIREDQQVALEAHQRQEIDQLLGEIDRRYFAAQGATAPLDLTGLITRWVAEANRRRAVAPTTAVRT
jgi:hypothetical protein